MPINSTGRQSSSSEPDGPNHGRSPSQSSCTSQDCSYEERCVDPVEERPPSRAGQSVRKAHPRDAGGKESETIGFIPGSADSPPAARTCGPCASPCGCKSFLCGVLTCGLYRVCQRAILAPCLAPAESAPDEPEKVRLRPVNAGDAESPPGKEAGGWPEDVHFRGVRVASLTREDSYVISQPPPPYGGRQPSSPPSFSLGYDDWDDGNDDSLNSDVDSLIAKKLLELYSEYQIEELAKCTSDSVFLRKTNEINRLISDLADEHKLEQRDAECRLVRGIIRISTRKSRKRRPQPAGPPARTLSDSGNETMKDSEAFSFSGSNNDYNVQISEETHSDVHARKMRINSGAHHSVSTTAHSPSQTQTDSSGAPLLRTCVRT